MASSSGPSRPIPIAEPAVPNEAADTQSPAASFSTSEALRATQDVCPWRTHHFRHQECSRFFDCPSHVLERWNSTAVVGQEPTALRGSPTTSTGALGPGREAFSNAMSNAGMPAGQRPEGIQPRRDTVAPGRVETSPPTWSGNLSGSATLDNGQMPIPSRTSSMMQTNGGASRPGSSRRSQSHDAPNALLDMSRDWHMASHAPSAPDEYRGSTSHTTRSGPAFRMDQASEGGMTQPQTREEAAVRGSTECMLPRWQPDAEVTYCPICRTQFSIFVRKHHCRKCGRVVCNSCSPHRIIIPHPYIVRLPGSEFTMPSSLLLDGLGAGYFEANGPSGGERVRLCNPCVPDPNTAPPQSPVPSAAASPRSSHQRSRSNHGSAFGVAHSTSAYAVPFPAGRGGDAYQYYSPRWRSVTMGPAAHGGPTGTSSQVRISTTYYSPLERYLAGASSSTPAPSRRNRHNSFGEAASSSSRHRALPPPPQIAEEDECPICHRELPSRELPDFEALRESHVSLCIQAHSTYGSPRASGGESAPHPAPRRTGMYTYAATEKDCIDDAECTICLEEFTVGVAMARLECLCRFHKACISAWFVNHPGRCPVHQHDGFGF